MDILVINLMRLGDLVQTSPVLRGLRARHREGRVTLVVLDLFQETARLLTGVDRLLPFPSNVAVISLNGTLSLFDDDSNLLWRLNLRATPYDLASFDGTAAAGQELLVATSSGILVVGADKLIQMNLTLPEPARVVAVSLAGARAAGHPLGPCRARAHP